MVTQIQKIKGVGASILKYVGLNITIATYHLCNFGQMTSSSRALVSLLVRWA